MTLQDNTPEYYRMRESQERELAAKAKDEGVRPIHLALADKYVELSDKESRFRSA